MGGAAVTQTSALWIKDGKSVRLPRVGLRTSLSSVTTDSQ